MKKLSQISLVALFTMFAFTLSALAQSNAQIEKELVAALKDIQKYGTYYGNYDEEKLPKAQDAFEKKLLKYTKIPATLSYKFSQLDEDMDIATSDDGKFRIYSWDMGDGGTMHNYASVYQYQGADGKIYSKTDYVNIEENGYGGYVTDIYTLDAGKVGKIYIVCTTFITSTQDRGESADLYKIEGAKLNDKVKLFKTKSGLTSTINFAYNFFSAANRKGKSVGLTTFDKRTKTLRIPVIIEDDEFPSGRVTNRSISYQFDGTYFVKVS